MNIIRIAILISSGCHLDLFTSNASGQMKNQMPYVDMEVDGGLR